MGTFNRVFSHVFKNVPDTYAERNKENLKSLKNNCSSTTYVSS